MNQRQQTTTALLLTGLLASCGGGGGGGGGGTDAPVDTSNISSWSQRDVKPLMTMARTSLWLPSDVNVGVIGMWNNVRLGAAQREGVIISSWGNTANPSAGVPAMRIALFEQGADGRLTDATASYVTDPLTQGNGRIMVADYNGDGKDDVVLTAYNETPPTPAAGVAFVSRADGRFDRIALGDRTSSIDMTQFRVNGQWRLLSSSAIGSNITGQPENVQYSWNGSAFDVTPLQSVAMIGSSLVAANFTGNAEVWVVEGSNFAGPGLAAGAAMVTRAWQWLGNAIVGAPVTLPPPYFNDKAEYASFQSWLDPRSKTDNARVWATDLNQDGLPDIVAGGQIWAPGPLLQKNVLQLLINQGGMRFVDMTDTLPSEYSADAEADMSMRLVDLDGSGIDSFLAAQHHWPDNTLPQRHGNYILVNDGTGRIYSAMHAEFEALALQVTAYVNTQAGMFVPSDVRPRFVPYRNAAGTLNYLAMVRAVVPGDTSGVQKFAFVNLPLAIDITTGFKRDLVVATRNGSRNIRTFAGNDTISRALGDPDCRIDGGLGVNTVVYPGRRADWVVTKVGSVITVVPAAGGGTDRLTRVQRARFDDQTLDLTTL